MVEGPPPHLATKDVAPPRVIDPVRPEDLEDTSTNDVHIYHPNHAPLRPTVLHAGPPGVQSRDLGLLPYLNELAVRPLL